MTRTGVLLAILAAVGAAGWAQEKKEEKKMPQIGDKAPEFSLKGSDGQTYTLKQYAGKQAVVLAWFPKAFTPG